jgi:hypothetical protein
MTAYEIMVRAERMAKSIAPQFYANIQGSRGEATRTGTKGSGIYGHVRGWNIGARVEMSHVDGKDVCRVYRTSGSSGREPSELIAEFTED